MKIPFNIELIYKVFHLQNLIMAKFLNTTGVSYHLEELIKGTKDKLILISPYLQFNERIKEHLNNLNIQKRDIRIIYRENKLRLPKFISRNIISRASKSIKVRVVEAML